MSQADNPLKNDPVYLLKADPVAYAIMTLQGCLDRLEEFRKNRLIWDEEEDWGGPAPEEVTINEARDFIKDLLRIQKLLPIPICYSSGVTTDGGGNITWNFHYNNGVEGDLNFNGRGEIDRVIFTSFGRGLKKTVLVDRTFFDLSGNVKDKKKG